MIQDERWLRAGVLAIVAAAALAFQFDLGERWFGNRAADPVNEPAAVLPPEGLKLPEVAVAAEVAGRVDPSGLDPARVAAQVRPLVRRGVLGPHVGVLVTDLDTGRLLFRSGAAAVTPASTTKLLTSAAALSSLGPMARFRTTVRYAPGTRQLVLVGGGDPALSQRTGTDAEWPYPVTSLADLAALTADALTASGTTTVTLGYRWPG